MRQFLFAIALFAVLGSAAVIGGSRAQAEATAKPVTIAIVPLGYVDTSGEVKNQTAAHQRRLHAFTRALRHALSASGKYRFKPISCGPTPCTSHTDPYTLQKAARAAGVKLVLLGGVQKMSTLVQWAMIQIVDEDAGHVIFDRLLTFRGDTDRAWQKAESFVAREILAAAPGFSAHAAAAPIKIAVFRFELMDFSAGGGIIPESAFDAKQLILATQTTRRLLAQSGRYKLVDVSHAKEKAVKTHTLRNCNGCEAAIALKLGAQQSLLGIVTRISRMEYVVTFHLRDARTGRLITTEQTGLRMGANYSWDFGAAWLVKNRFLAKASQK